jgi:predicted nucleic acid-binding protein
MLVVDASAVSELLLGRPPAPAVAEALAAHAFDLHAPQLLDVEVLSVVRRLVLSGEASARRGEEALDDLFALPIERYPHDVLARRAWDHRDNFSAYDATYLALAEALALEPPPVLTADARFARAARAHTAVPVILAGRRR